MELVKDDGCFVCGTANPRGLKVEVKRWQRGAVFEFEAKETFKGWSQYLHGGVIGMLFDELLGWTSRFFGYTALTARLEIRYRRPVPLRTKLIFRGELQREVKKLLFINTFALFEDGTVAAEGKGTMMIVKKAEGAKPPQPHEVNPPTRR